MADKPTNVWDEAKPAGTRDANLGDDDIREMKQQLREVISQDHEMESSGQDEDWGYHKQVTLLEQADLGTGAVDATILGSQTYGGKGELTYTDEDDNDVIITQLGYLNLDAARVSNNTYIISRNAAGDGNINIIKVNASDEVVLGAVTELPDSSRLATDAAPAEDEEIANKKYVDDEIAAGVKRLGDWVTTYLQGQNNLAPCDGFVVARIVYNSSGNEHTISILTDAANPPTTLRAQWQTKITDGYGQGSCMCPVKSGDYWKVTGTNLGTAGVNHFIYWIPLST